MKLLLLLAIALFSHTSISQVWVDQNAKWHYDYSNVGSAGFYEMDYVQDTIVGGKLCQQIVGTQYTFGLSEPGGNMVLINTSALPTRYTYSSSDTVFYWNDNQFFTLFDFGASIGDQWQIGSGPAPWGGCNDSSFVEVIDTGSIALNSQNYRTISLSTVSGSSLGLEGVFVERFGWMDSNLPFQPFPSAQVCDTPVVVEWDYVSFKCFEDDSFSLYNPSGEDCEYFLTHLGLEDQLSGQTRVFPNPTSDFVQIDVNEEVNLQILDYSGNLIRIIESYNSEQIDLSSIESGMYVFVLTGSSGSTIRRQVIKID